MTDGRGHPNPDGRDRPASRASVDDLLDRAVAAINRGDRVTARALAEQVLAARGTDAEAEDLLAAPRQPGLIRRLTILFADLVDSTALSTRVEPETYRILVGRYRDQVRGAVDRYEGHIGFTKGDGLLAVFGHPVAHEDDARRAVLAGLEITREVARLSDQAKRRLATEVNVRVGVHRGLVYLDTGQGGVDGLAANLAARVCDLAPAGAVVVSDAVEMLIRDDFELKACPAALVKGVEEPVSHYRVLGERGRATRPGQGPLVGRDRELAQLESAWSRAQSGTLDVPGIAFRGEPGIGKSRLAAAAAELVEASGATVLDLVGSPFHTEAGLHPVRTLLERRCGIDRSTGQTERLRLLDVEVRARGMDPQNTVPLLAPVLGIDAETGYQQVAAEGRRLYELVARAVRTYLLTCLGDGAGLVVAEDVHWFDPSTLEVLGALLKTGQGRLLVVMTGRPGGWTQNDWPHAVLDLAPLTDDETDALITALDPDLPADQRSTVAARCDGVPFYIEQLVNGLGQTGVPETLYEPLVARLRTTPKAVPVVEAAAVIGRQFDRGLLYSVVDLRADEIDDALAELGDALVLESWHSSDNYRFRHELLREVAAELAPPSVRRALHAKVADALGGAGEPDWQLVAGHYDRADAFHEAASAYQRASTDALARGALAEAHAYLTRALTDLDRASSGPDRDRLEMALRLERARLTRAVEGYQSGDAAADYERCLQLAGTDMSDRELFATLAALEGYYVTRADLRRVVEVLEALRTGLVHGREWFEPVIESNTGLVAFLRGEFASATSHLEAATAGLAAVPQHTVNAGWFLVDEPLAYAHTHLAWARFVRGDLTGAETELARAARHAKKLGFPPLGPYIIGYACSVEIGMRIEAGQLDRAAVLAPELSALGERHGFDVWRLVGAVWQALVRGLQSVGTDGDQTSLAADIATVTTLLDGARQVGLNLFLTFYDGIFGRLLLAAGQFETARHRFDTGLALSRETGMRFYDAELLRLRAQTFDDSATRRTEIGAALDLARRQGAPLFQLRAALDDFDVGGEPARAELVEALGRMPIDFDWPELARARATLSTS
ncbi:ATP-binding protein [Mycobacterium sp. NPDC048908]|uniref:ATP-binding protein n=1 Tax=Mycobacterium sp. NPDC048908 TaxID=3364292 RepID=UPI003711D66C